MSHLLNDGVRNAVKMHDSGPPERKLCMLLQKKIESNNRIPTHEHERRKQLRKERSRLKSTSSRAKDVPLRIICFETRQRVAEVTSVTDKMSKRHRVHIDKAKRSLDMSLGKN